MKWGSLAEPVPVGEWVSLLENVSSRTALPNIRTIQFTPSKAITPEKQIDSSSQLTVYIGSVRLLYSGVGVARALRAHFPSICSQFSTLRLIALDDPKARGNGFNETVFDEYIATELLNYDLPEEYSPHLADLVEDLITRTSNSYYIPNLDHEVEFLAPYLSSARWESVKRSTRSDILSCNMRALEATQKPDFQGTDCMKGLFHVPLYMDAREASLMDIEAFCKKHGYPVLVKGLQYGATVCTTWQQVCTALHSCEKGCYVQVIVPGFQMGISFAAYQGELTGCIQMRKCEGSKAWTGDLQPCAPRVVSALETFCKLYNYTGGSELEFIEDIYGRWWCIDWNPRFPSWIYGGTFAGVNLPGMLLQHALCGIGKVPIDRYRSLCASGVGRFTRTVGQ